VGNVRLPTVDNQTGGIPTIVAGGPCQTAGGAYRSLCRQVGVVHEGCEMLRCAAV